MGVELFCFSSWAALAPVSSLQVELKQHLTYAQYLYQTLTDELDIEKPVTFKGLLLLGKHTRVGIDLSSNYWQLFCCSQQAVFGVGIRDAKPLVSVLLSFEKGRLQAIGGHVKDWFAA